MRHFEIIYPYWYTNQTRHFRVTSSLCFKARLSAEPLIWTWVFILLQTKLIFTTKVWHLASLWKWEVLELGNGLLNRVGENLASNKLSAVEQFFSSNTKKQCSIWLLFNNYSLRSNGQLTQRPWGREEYYCFSKIQLVGQKYRDKTTLASKTRFSRHCFGFQSRRFCY